MRWLFAWIFALAGDWIWRASFKRWYVPYNWLMVTSAKIQGDNDNGPWNRTFN
jgi:hypothetical protein